MATPSNLTPEQLQWLQQQYGGSYTDSSGRTWRPVQAMTSGGPDGQMGYYGANDGWRVSTSGGDGYDNGATYDQYNPDGTYKTSGTVQNGSFGSDLMTALKYFAPVAGVGLLGASMAGAGAAGGGAGSGVAGDAFMPGTMGAGDAFMPGTMGAGDAYLPGALQVSGDAYMPGIMAPLDPSIGWTGMPVSGSTLGTVGRAAIDAAKAPAAPTVGGGMSSLLGGGSSSLLGLAAPIAGAVLGSQGTKNETTATKQLPDYLQGPVVNDLIPRAQGLLAQQMSPERMAGFAQMRNVGQGLLSNPIAGNGYSMFQGRR